MRTLHAIALLLPVTAAAAEPMDIGSRRELFVDRALVAELRSAAELRLHHPQPQEVVLRHGEPWEGNTCGYFTIFRDGEKFRMYYRGSHHDREAGEQTHRQVTCYAESPDGIHWEKPNLGLYSFNGSKKNNIVWDGIGTHNFTPFKDPNPEAADDAKYKALGRGTKRGKGLYAFQSPDGIHWSLMQKEPVITKGAFDSQNLAFWDPVREEYREYHRDFRKGKRAIRTATSKNFLDWSEPKWLKYPEAPREHMYTNAVMPYYRAPHIFIGFPTRYIPGRGSLTEGLLMASRDGRTFHRWEEALIRPGANPDKWQNRSNYIWWGLIETESDLPGDRKELSLFVNEGYYEGKSSRTRRYTIRIDGFVSAHAPMSGGTLVTKPVVFDGNRLSINFATSAAGSVRVGLASADGKAIDGYAASDCPPIYGDALDKTVRWKGGADVGDLAGQAVRLRFHLKDADVYSFRFQDAGEEK